MTKHHNSAIIYLVIGLIIGSIVTYTITSSIGGNPVMGMMGFRNQNTLAQNRTMMGNIDRHFIEQMIPHHEDAITMAEIAVEKAKRPEIKTLAQNVIKTQQEENSQMKNWYRSWFNEDVPSGESVMGMHGMMGGGMHMGMMGDDTDITALQNAVDFDKVFIEQMIPHHQMAIMMASMLESSTNRQDMKNLAQRIISAQTKEINDMRTWYNEWYR